MLFNSFEFLVFFPIVVAFYFSIPHRFRWLLLLTASYYFYMCWKAEYIVLIIISTAIDYFSGIMMERQNNKTARKKYLILSLFSNLGLLFAFKYLNFFSQSFRSTLNTVNIFYEMPLFDILLPVGISFYTFQTLSYTFDVYNGTTKPEKHFGIFALYVAFFPQLVAGPIERSSRLLPQFRKETEFNYVRVTDGLKLMLWGFFKKVVIADRLAVVVNTVYNNPNEYNGFPLILATFFFAFQIFCDFSGYSDIAIGTAQVMGYKLMTNFNRPYFSKSISEFWKRWHISLSTWFRDYLYFSLGGNRVGKSRWYLNLFLTFLISGFWHGANWTFIVWGGLNGFYLIFSIWTHEAREKLCRIIGLSKFPNIHKCLKVSITFLLTCFAWIFFRASSISDAFYIIINICTGTLETLSAIFQGNKLLLLDLLGQGRLGLDRNGLLVAFSVIIFMEVVHLIQRRGSIRCMLSSKPLWFRWSLYYAMVITVFLLGSFEKQEFIYFQF